MSDTVKNPSTEQLILDAIYHIEKYRKKRTDIEQICNIIVCQETGLSKKDAFEIISQLHKEGVLNIKMHEVGPVSYKINKDYNGLNQGCHVGLFQAKFLDFGLF